MFLFTVVAVTNVMFSKVLTWLPVIHCLNNGLSKCLGASIYTVVVAPLLADKGVGKQLQAMAYVCINIFDVHMLTICAKDWS
jgi:hypothetical protein